MNLKIEKHFNTISWHVILAYVIYNNEIIVKISVYTFDMHVLVNKVYKKKILSLVVNICLNTANILIYAFLKKKKL